MWTHSPPLCVCLSVQGTVLVYQPGLLSGGSVEHDCNMQRSLGYYLEALLMLAPFMKTPLKATLRGVTNDPSDPTVRTRMNPDGFLFLHFDLILTHLARGAETCLCKETPDFHV